MHCDAPARTVQKHKAIEDVDEQVEEHTSPAFTKNKREDMDTVLDPYQGYARIAEQEYKPPQSLLRRSPRFDDKNISVIYEDLGITGSPSPGFEASTPSTETDEDR